MKVKDKKLLAVYSDAGEKLGYVQNNTTIKRLLINGQAYHIKDNEIMLKFTPSSKFKNKFHFNTDDKYTTVKVYSNTDTFRTYTNMIRAKSLVNKGFAEWISDAEIRMKGDATDFDEFRYIPFEKRKCCMECGIKLQLTNHHIIPKQFMKVMSKMGFQWKNSLFVTFLCKKCHNEYEEKANIFKHKILGINPLDSKEMSARRDVENILFRLGKNLYPSTKERHEKRLKVHVDTYGESILSGMWGVDQKPIIEYVNKNGFKKIIEVWTDHFFSSMELKYFPEVWKNSIYEYLNKL